MGQENVVEMIHPLPSEFGTENGDSGEGAGVHQHCETIPPVEPGTDEFAKTFQCRLVQIDADEVVEVHVASFHKRMVSGPGPVYGEAQFSP
jgi:hypothetical protein